MDRDKYDFICPIMQDIMEDPVITCDGHTFERAAIEDWFRRGNRKNPMTGLRMQSTQLIPNIALKKIIQEEKKRIPENEKLKK